MTLLLTPAPAHCTRCRVRVPNPEDGDTCLHCRVERCAACGRRPAMVGESDCGVCLAERNAARAEWMALEGSNS